MSDDERDIRAALQREAERAPRPTRLRDTTVRRAGRRRGGVVVSSLLGVVVLIAGGALAYSSFGTDHEKVLPVIPGPSESTPVGRIAFSRFSGNDGGIMTMNADGTDVRRVADGDEYPIDQPAWSPNGNKISFHGFYGEAANEGGGLFVMNADGSDVELLELAGDAPTWSPDGKQIAFYSGEDGSIRVITLDSRQVEIVLPQEGQRLDTPDWSPDARRLAVGGVDITLIDTNGDRQEVIVDRAGEALLLDPQWSPDGDQIAYTEWADSTGNEIDTSTVKIVDTRNGESRTLTDGADPTWSPDGTRIAFERIDGDVSHIYSIDVDGSDLQQLTAGPGSDHSPDWTSEAPSDQRASTTHRNDELDLAITTPAEWTIQWSASPQSTTLYGATFAFDRSNGFCSKQGPLTTLPPDGAFFWMYEFDLPDAPLRPESFSFDEQSFASYEGSGCVGTYRIDFSDSDRTFSIHVAFGSEATATLRDEVTAALDSLEVQSGAVEDPPPEITAEAEIYAAVVRRLVTKDHTFGGAASPFKHVYIVDGSIPDAGNPHKDTLRPASERFTDELKMEIEEQLRDLPPLEFIVDPSDVRRGEQGMDGVENDGVIITLGPIERKGTEVRVSNGLWCSGRCGQWLTYVLEERGGVWKVTGTTGPSAIS